MFCHTTHLRSSHCEGCQHSAPKNETEVQPKQLRNLFLQGTSGKVHLERIISNVQSHQARKITSRNLLRREHMGAPHTCAESAKTNLSNYCAFVCPHTMCFSNAPPAPTADATQENSSMPQLRMPQLRMPRLRHCRAKISNSITCGCRNCECRDCGTAEPKFQTTC